MRLPCRRGARPSHTPSAQVCVLSSHDLNPRSGQKLRAVPLLVTERMSITCGGSGDLGGRRPVVQGTRVGIVILSAASRCLIFSRRSCSPISGSGRGVEESLFGVTSERNVNSATCRLRAQLEEEFLQFQLILRGNTGEFDPHAVLVD